MSPSQRPTRRELEALARMLNSCRKQAADEMGVTDRTVKNHLASLYGKLDVESASEAAIALGWLCLPRDLMGQKDR